MKSYLKTALTQTSFAVDTDTGELIEHDVKTVKYLTNSREQFYLVYSSLIGLLQKMTLPEVRVYCYLLENYQIGSPIGLNIDIKKIIAEKQELKVGTVNNAISALTNKKLLYSIGRGTYKLNPRFAFQGSTKDRNAMLKVILEIECPEC